MIGIRARRPRPPARGRRGAHGRGWRRRDPLGRLAGLALLSLAVGCEPSSSPPSAPLPTRAGAPILLVTVDTLRADAVGLLGGGDATPAIDAFFGAGQVFENTVSSAPCTVPSVAQLLTGRFAWEAPAATLAEGLREAGYRTGAVVSQHHFRGGDEAAVYARGFDGFDVQAAGERDRHGLSTRDAAAVSERALAWIAERPAGTAWFLWLHYFDPHDPYEPPAPHRPPPGASRRDGDRRTQLMRERRPGEPWTRAGHIYGEDDVRHLRALYRGEVAYVDAQLGRVLAALEARGEAADALVLLTADHGEQLGEGGRWDHCTSLLEEEIRVPLLVRAGGRWPAGGRRSDAASTLDLLPSVLAWAGVPAPAGLDGRDLARPDPARRVLSFWSPAASVRDSAWKLVERVDAEGEGAVRLHPVRATPPYERSDHAAARPEVLAGLRRALAGRRAERLRLQEREAAVRERLRRLGYAE